MLLSDWRKAPAGLFLLLAGGFLGSAAGGELTPPPAQPPRVAAASDEGALAMRAFTMPPGFRVELFAAEPDLANPVAFTIDHQGRFYVAETFRLHAGVTDIRGKMAWLDEDLAARTVEDRIAMMKRQEGDRFLTYEQYSERVRMLVDENGDGRADRSTVFAEGFNTAADGIASGVLAVGDDVYFANIPNLWLLNETDGDGVAEERRSLHYGYGVRVGFIGHDLHGLIMGPDGRLYFTIGDRGASVEVDGSRVGDPDSGTVFRCNPDGSGLEVFARGLRNPQELAFDQFGNLFTGDNNSDGGDRARILHLVEGGDYGWRIGFQFIERPNARGPWNAERMWHTFNEGQPAYILPAITNITDGPSGFAFYPGTGLPAQYDRHFFLVDFHGGRSSGIHSFTLDQHGAGFRMASHERFLWDALPTDVTFGTEGGIYFLDWVEGWGMTGKGRIYRVFHPEGMALVKETKELLAAGMGGRSPAELGKLLAHADMRVRQEAQFELARRGGDGLEVLLGAARGHDSLLARIHGAWGMEQASRTVNQRRRERLAEITAGWLGDSEPEMRAQAARLLGEMKSPASLEPLTKAASDPVPRVRAFAAASLGKLGNPAAVPVLATVLRENQDRDPYVRHAAANALAAIGDMDALSAISGDGSASVRMGVVLALRRMERGEIAHFLNDENSLVAIEAARAINDVPITSAIPDLAAFEQRLTAGQGEWSRDLARRVVNANYRFGTAGSAQALARLAAHEGLDEGVRAEALAALGNWQHPSGRDQVTGLWRPVIGSRAAGDAVRALEPALATLLGDGPPQVQAAAARAAAGLNISSAGELLRGLFGNRDAAPPARIAALTALADLNDSRFQEALQLASSDASEDLRREALRLQSRLAPGAALAQLRQALAQGTLREKQTALATLGLLPDREAGRVLEGWLEGLLAGGVDPHLRADLLSAAEKRNSRQLRELIAQYQASFDAADDLAPYRDLLLGGDPEEGRKIFFERTEASCLRCHKVDGVGGEVGPDLTGIASKYDREYLLESLVLPNKSIAEGFESVTLVTRDGFSHLGVVKEETDDSITINSAEDGLLTISKSEIERRQQALSPMPEGLTQTLTRLELRDLVEYLASLK